MIKCAKKYHVALDVAKPNAALRKAMPIWYHPELGDGRDVSKTASAICLRSRHEVKTVGQCMRVAQRLTHPSGMHRQNGTCECGDCLRDRIDRGCDNPHRCAVAANKLTLRLRSKWDPKENVINDGLSLTKDRLEQNEVAREERGRVTFDPSLTQGLPLALTFRAF
ncbi:hypothetical protein C8Q70DRAFT_893816, partial [Cubamyces menziesii]